MQPKLLFPWKLLLLALAWAWLQGGTARVSVAAPDASDSVQEHLRSRLVALALPPSLTVATERLRALGPLLLFYERRAYQPAWSQNATLLPHVNALVTAVQEVHHEGLRPADYHLAQIHAMLAAIRHRHDPHPLPDPDQLADLDLLLTDAFLLYSSHLLAGRIDPETEHTEWKAKREKPDLASLLETALATQQVEAALRSVRPSHPAYAGLQKALARYRGIAAAGGWPVVPDSAKIQPGDRDARVRKLRARLRVESGLPKESPREPDLYEEGLARAVRTFQRRHGLSGDGVAGPATLAALNMSAAARARQIEFNLERRRWLPREPARRTVVVNIANFSLEAWEYGQPALTMRVAVGTPLSSTPVFSAAMTYLVLNPAWRVPRSVAIEEMLPRIRRNPRYLDTQRLTVLQQVDGETKTIDPRTIKWAKLSSDNFPYRLRQEPGLTNALGRVKFMFPNPFQVYLHDTPSRSVFTRTVRTFSHGCIRIEEPIELATYLLRESQQWSEDTLVSALDHEMKRTVWLPEPIPVHMVYWTAWVDQEGVLQFRPDVYGYDTLLDKALRQAPPLL